NGANGDQASAVIEYAPRRCLKSVMPAMTKRCSTSAAAFVSGQHPYFAIDRTSMRAFGESRRQHRTHHQLNLMEQHQRQNNSPYRLSRKDHLRHGNPAGQAFFRAAKEQGDAVLDIK